MTRLLIQYKPKIPYESENDRYRFLYSIFKELDVAFGNTRIFYEKISTKFKTVPIDIPEEEVEKLKVYENIKVM